MFVFGILWQSWVICWDFVQNGRKQFFFYQVFHFRCVLPKAFNLWKYNKIWVKISILMQCDLIVFVLLANCYAVCGSLGFACVICIMNGFSLWGVLITKSWGRAICVYVCVKIPFHLFKWNQTERVFVIALNHLKLSSLLIAHLTYGNTTI